jgi:TatD DNase family protein
MPYPIVDSHCHLDFDSLSNDINGVLGRAADAGVHLMVTISTRVRKFRRILKIAEAHPFVYCSVGTHPHNAADETDVTADELVELARHPKVVAIGEAGLDYHYDHSPRDAQAASFRVHIDAARRTGLPLVIHSRSAEADTAKILSEEMAKGAFKPLLHCFSSNSELARAGIELGAYFSFSGILTFKNAAEIHQAARTVPEDHLLVETDAPYLAPVPFRGKPNEPAYAVHTMRRLAELREVSEQRMARVTSENFFRLFDKVAQPTLYAEAS